MRIGMLIAGFIMLCNPVIYLIDVLPDVIGVALIIIALTKSSYLVGKIDRARVLFQKLLIVEAVNLFAFPIVAVTYESDQATMALLLAFSIGVVELIFFIPAVVHLFDGIYDNGIAFSDNSLFAVKKVKRVVRDPLTGAKTMVETEKSALTGTRDFIIIFYILRICASVLPELTSLDDGTIRSGGVYLADFKRTLYIFSILFVLILSVVNIVKVCRTLGKIGKDKTFISSIEERFEREIKPRTTLFIAKRMKLVLILFGLSLITLIFRDLDIIGYGTAVFGCAFLSAAAILMAKYNKLTYAVIPLSVINCGLTIYNNIFNDKYYAEHREIEAIYWVEEAKAMYDSMAVLRLIEFVFAAVIAILFIVLLLKTAKEHISLCGIVAETVQYSKKNKDAETYKSVKTRLIASMVFAVIAMVFGGIYHYTAISTQAAGALYVVTVAVYIAYTIASLYALDDRIYDSELEIA
ncbi:MAG: hypothetical protein E7628_03275 [Ruminococcaceae bacterium]|nr:hypothetical protein [Oscillospiraceae bacterium]